MRISGVEIGLSYDAAPLVLTPVVYAQQLTLENHRYADNFGAKLRGDYQYNAGTQFFGLGQFEKQKNFAIPTSTTAPEKSGRKYTLGLGVNYSLNPAMKISAEMNHIIKHSQRNFNDYRAQKLMLSHNWMLGKGMFLYTSFSGEITRYRIGDPSVSGLARHDRLGSIGLTFGIPLDAVISADIPISGLRDLFITISVSASRQLSNLTNYTYNNRTASIQFSKRWEF